MFTFGDCLNSTLEFDEVLLLMGSCLTNPSRICHWKYILQVVAPSQYAFHNASELGLYEFSHRTMPVSGRCHQYQTYHGLILAHCDIHKELSTPLGCIYYFGLWKPTHVLGHFCRSVTLIECPETPDFKQGDCRYIIFSHFRTRNGIS